GLGVVAGDGAVGQVCHVGVDAAAELPGGVAGDGAVEQVRRGGGGDAPAGEAGVVAADDAVDQVRRAGADAAAVIHGGGVAADGAAGHVDQEGADAAAFRGDVALDGAAHDVEHAPLVLGVDPDADPAAQPPGHVAADDTAGQGDVARPRQGGVGDAAAVAG